MYRRSIISSIIILVFSLSACTEESNIIPEEPIQEQLPDIPSQLIPHFQNFSIAAADRGINITFNGSGITAELSDINQGSVAGICSTNNRGLRHITIDLDFWNRASFLLREMIVFHELGHCVLGRGHDEEAFSNGLCKSIMRSGTGSCRDAYRNNTRSYYMDELFGSEIIM